LPLTLLFIIVIVQFPTHQHIELSRSGSGEGSGATRARAKHRGVALRPPGQGRYGARRYQAHGANGHVSWQSPACDRRRVHSEGGDEPMTCMVRGCTEQVAISQPLRTQRPGKRRDARCLPLSEENAQSDTENEDPLCSVGADLISNERRQDVL